MSHSMLAPTDARPWSDTDETTVVDDEETLQTLLDVLDDTASRTLLEATSTSDGALTANELSERCDVPLSTTYRKLDVLTDAGLLEERIRIRRSGRHTNEYVARVDDISISVDADRGLTLTLTERADGRETWSSLSED